MTTTLGGVPDRTSAVCELHIRPGSQQHVTFDHVECAELDCLRSEATQLRSEASQEVGGSERGAGMRQPLQVEVARPGTDVVVRGRLDSLSCDELRTALRRAVADGEGDLVVHADGLEIWG